MAHRAFNLALATPWAIQEESLNLILEIAERENPPIDVVEARRGEPLNNSRTTTVRNGVAVIPVTGPIFPRANLFTRISGGTSVSELAVDFMAALESEDVSGILLNIDSPGGQVNGVNELANMIHAARGQKPVLAYISGLGASGAYWIASAADRIYADATAQLGSIGVIMGWVDDSMAEAQQGVKRVTIVSSQSPKKGLEPNTAQGRAQVQDIVDSLATVFVEAVARNRNVSTDKVLNDFGSGGVLIGAQAVKAGLADGLASFEQVLATFPRQQINRRGEQGPGTELVLSGPEASGGEEMAKERNWFARFFAGASPEEKREALEALMEGNSAGAPSGASPEKPAVASSGATASGMVMVSESELEKLRGTSARVDRLEEQIARDKTTARNTAAEQFVETEVRAGRLLPAEKEAVKAEYLRAALDDELHPVAQGEKSRTALITERQSKRPAHLFMTEMLPGGLPPGAGLIPSTVEDPNPIAAAAAQAEAYAEQANRRTRGNTRVN